MALCCCSVEYETLGAFYYPDDATLDATTPLAPFYSRRGDLINSNDIRNIRALGYFYARLRGTPLTIDTAAASAVAAAAAAGVDPGTAALANVSDSVEAVAVAARPAAGADAWASTITSMAPDGTYGWAVSGVDAAMSRLATIRHVCNKLMNAPCSSMSALLLKQQNGHNVPAASSFVRSSTNPPAEPPSMAELHGLTCFPSSGMHMICTQDTQVCGPAAGGHGPMAHTSKHST